MSPQRAQDANIAKLQALLPADSREPRIAPARPRELRPLARIVAELAGRVTPGGPPNIFTTLGQHPRLFRSWVRYSAHLMPFGQLPRQETELVILRVAWQCRSAYEWHQHVPIALRVGLSPDEVAGVANSPPTGNFTERQRALLAASDELLARRALSDTTWSAVQANLSNREAIEVCLLIGNYQGLASTIGGLAIQIESPAATQTKTKELEHRIIDRIRHGIQERLDQLLAEADKLRRALIALDPRERSTPPPVERARPWPASKESAAKPSAAKKALPKPPSTRTRAASLPARSAAGATKAKVLGALSNDGALTAGEVAKLTGLDRATVSATLSKLAKSGEIAKAERGYRLPDSADAPNVAQGPAPAAKK